MLEPPKKKRAYGEAAINGSFACNRLGRVLDNGAKLVVKVDQQHIHHAGCFMSSFLHCLGKVLVERWKAEFALALRLEDKTVASLEHLLVSLPLFELGNKQTTKAFAAAALFFLLEQTSKQGKP